MFILFFEIVALTFSYERIARISSEETPCTINGTINLKKKIFFFTTVKYYSDVVIVTEDTSTTVYIYTNTYM